MHSTTRQAGQDRRLRSASPGFTLLELLVVIIVLGLLAGLVAPQIFGRVGEAKVTTARTQMALVGTALDSYRLDNGAYPTTEQGLQALREKPAREPLPTSWRGPYLRKDVPLDPWGHPYLYRAPGLRNPTGYDLATLGRDGKEGGSGEDADLTGQ
jgi:general secretion pathway protein G